MFVSATPLFKEVEWIDRSGDKHKSVEYVGGSGIEYCWGGKGNGLFTIQGYYSHEQIGIFENVNDRITKTASTIPTMSGGYDLQFDIIGSINNYNASNLDVLEQFRSKCDIESCIVNFDSNNSRTHENLDSLKLCVEKINNVVNKKQDKKSVLKALLGKFKDNKNKIESMGSKQI